MHDRIARGLLVTRDLDFGSCWVAGPPSALTRLTEADGSQAATAPTMYTSCPFTKTAWVHLSTCQAPDYHLLLLHHRKTAQPPALSRPERALTYLFAA